MKTLSYFFALFIGILPLSAIAQKYPIQIFEEKEEHKVTLKASNTLEQTIRLTLDLTSEGLGIEKNKTFTQEISAKETVTLIVLEPQPNKKWSYKYSSSYQILPDPSQSPAVNTGGNPLVLPDHKGIIVYTKKGCGRCDFTAAQLEKNKIAFQDKPIENETYLQEMHQYLFASGFPGGRFSTPAIIVDGTIYYSIDDLPGFVANLIETAKKE
ncbi:glutaredoxin domain-containing protein [Lewinella sp. W8]|uniref:glutaredoxin family protein n=1 Tax=Lewinella sp. W8 TaxID=2528208 RepID=UPI00106763C2|nr:glutaredoxin domain-containing protein [Lewinella sp. W8]MTB51923.1 hypothetical protein [Lewinella sp. W8]